MTQDCVENCVCEKRLKFFLPPAFFPGKVSRSCWDEKRNSGDPEKTILNTPCDRDSLGPSPFLLRAQMRQPVERTTHARKNA